MTAADHTTVKVPHFKLNEKTGRYTARRTLTKEQIIKAAKKLLYTSNPRGKSFTDSLEAALYLKDKYSDYEQEVFVCLFLNNEHRLIHEEIMFTGTINSGAVYPREVVKKALAVNAAALIVCHNHPSGITEPSPSDIRITFRLDHALELVDIRLLDHIIVGDGAISLAQNGYIKK